MPHQVTITAQTGPARQVTAAVVPALSVDFQLVDKRLFIQTEQGVGDNIREFDLTGVTAITCTITAGNFAFTVS